MAIVSDVDREQVASARLAALETDGGLPDNFGADSDAEFQLEDSEPGEAGILVLARCRYPL